MTLFDPDDLLDGKVGRDHPHTSRQSAHLGIVGFATERARVLLAIAASGSEGRTAAEVTAIVGGVRNQIAARMLELREGGWIVYQTSPNGERVVRATDGGHRALVQVLNPEARQDFARWISEYDKANP